MSIFYYLILFIYTSVLYQKLEILREECSEAALQLDLSKQIVERANIDHNSSFTRDDKSYTKNDDVKTDRILEIKEKYELEKCQLNSLLNEKEYILNSMNEKMLATNALFDNKVKSLESDKQLLNSRLVKALELESQLQLKIKEYENYQSSDSNAFRILENELSIT